MTEVATAYAEFWSGRGWREVGGVWQEIELPGMGFRNAFNGQLIPAFRGLPPPSAPFPHIQYPVFSTEMFTNRVANTAFIRDRRPAMMDFYGLVDDVLRIMEDAIPPLKGNRLILPSGTHIKLLFANADTGRDFDDTTGATVQGIFNFNIRMR